MGEASSLGSNGLGVNFGMIVTIIFLAFVLFGFIVGLVRGFKKSFIRTIWILVLGIVSIFITIPLTLSLIRADISAIAGSVLNGAKSIEEFLIITLSQSIEGIDTQAVANIVTLLTSVVAMFISGIVFLILFIILKYLSLPFYWILNIFIARNKDGKKRRLLGGLFGVFLGIILFTFMSTPFVGYVNAVREVDKLVQIPVASASSSEEDANTSGGIISGTPAEQILNELSNSPIMLLYDAVGLKKLQIYIFNETSSVKVNGEKIKINDELEAFGKILVYVTPLTDGTYEFSNIEELSKNPEQFQGFIDTLNNLIDSLYESKILKASISYAMPVVKTFIEDTVIGVIENSTDIDPTLIDPTVAVLKDFCDGLLEADSNDIRTALNAVFNIVKVLPKLNGENAMENLTTDDFGVIGNVFDSFVASGLVKSENISALVPAVIDIVINTSDESSIPQELRGILEDVRESFKNNTTMVYSNEFKAVGEIIVGISNLNLENEGEEFDANLIKEIGAVLDKTASHNSVIFTNALLDDIVLTMFDMVGLGGIDEDSEYEDIYNRIKTPFENHTVTSYAVEFDAIAEAISLFNTLNEEETFDYSNFGEKLDAIIAKGSKCINHDFVNNLIKVFIDDIANVETEDIEFTETLDSIKNNFTGNNLSYKVEFVSIEKLITIVDDMEEDNFEISRLGATFDEIIDLNSKVMTRQIINSLIQESIDVLVDVDTPSNADFTSNIQSIKEGFNRTDLRYSHEFGAIEELINSINSMQEKDFSLIQIGKDLDDVIAYDSKIVTKSLINSFMEASFNDFVPTETISHAGKLTEPIKDIKSRLKDPNYNIASYETEFTAIDKLLEVSEVVGEVTITHIEDKILENGTKTIGDVFDETIKDSVLVGDSGLNEMSILLKEFEEANNGQNGKRDYRNIILIIENNYEALKPSVKCGSNKNLTASNTLSYKEVTHAFTEIVTYLDSEETKITDQTEFDVNIANRYESVLSKLQSNMMLQKHGTRAVAAYVADEIASVLEQQAIDHPEGAVAIRGVKTIMLNYKEYLNRPTTLSNNRLNEEEPYDKAGNEYVYSTDGFVTNISYPTTQPENNFAFRNCPFSSIAKLLPKK